MRKEIKIYISMIVLVFVSLFIGIKVFLVATEVQNNFGKLIGFFLSICDFIICAGSVLFMGRYSKQIERYIPKLVLSGEKEKHVLRLMNYIMFFIIVITSLIIFILIGILFFGSNDNYWLFLDAITAILMAMIISFTPWLNEIKKKLYQSSWEHLFIIVIVLFVILIGLFAFFSVN